MSTFPLPFVPTLNWSGPAKGGRYFGAPRPKGRLHAGCDLIAKVGTEVFAIDSGVVLFSKRFNISYLPSVHVWEIMIVHPHFHARYCELSGPAPGIEKGAQVQQGQVIGYVGKLTNSSMLHFELYKGDSSDYPTKPGNTKYLYVPNGGYMRRSDLLDPSQYLDQWRANVLVCA